jgi:hypothetical protein
MLDPRTTHFRITRRQDRTRYPMRRHARRLPDSGDVKPEPKAANDQSPGEPAAKLFPQARSELPSVTRAPWLPPSLPANADQAIIRTIAISIAIMVVAILWLAWKVASDIVWPS